jgi:PDZ domain-containing protein
VTLYTSDDNGMPLEPLRARATPAQRRWRWGSALVAGSVILTVALTATPAPYVIEQPGPTFNTLGTVSVATEDGDKKDKVPLITIDGATTFPTEGNLNLLTVNVLGVPESLPSWGDIILSWFDSSKAVVPVDAVFPPNVTNDDRQKENTALMVNSQHDAIAAALTYEGYDVVSGIEVVGFADDSPSEGALRIGDVVTSINGFAPQSVQQLRDKLTAAGAGTTVTLTVLRDGKPVDVDVAPYESDSGDVVLGIGASVAYDFPFDVTIRLDDVGGPSAGMMFALGIIDKLTPGSLNGGLNISGTGTIDNLGNVGPIGGIRQKLFGAKNTGSTLFLAPEANCDAVVGNTPDGIAVFAIGSLNEATDVLSYLVDHPTAQVALADASDNDVRTCDAVVAAAKK